MLHKPSRNFCRWTILTLTGVLLASSAGAALYTVTLHNGTTFQTRYEPVDAEWSDEISMIQTDRGNWIALEKADIADVVSEAEARGFGYQLDTTTIVLGWSPNDLVTENEDGEIVNEWGFPDDDLGSSGFTLEQFVAPPVVGTGLSSGGLPVQFVNQSPE